LPRDAEHVKSLDTLTQRAKPTFCGSLTRCGAPGRSAIPVPARALRRRRASRHARDVLRLVALARLALTLVVAIVIGLGVLGSSRVASACMRLSLIEAPCCAAMRSPVRLESPESCCREGTLGKSRAADLERGHGDVADAPCVAQQRWSSDTAADTATSELALAPGDRARPPPRAPHLSFTVLRC
jgi:hypothetical protein